MATEIPDTPASEPRIQERVVLAPCTHHPLQDGERLLVRAGVGTRLRVSGRVAHLLARCTTLRTVEEHARVAAAELPFLFPAPAEACDLLLSLREAGLFISSRELGRAVTGAPDPTPGSASVTVCLVTRDRPDLLERAVESALTGEPTVGDPQFWVVDDSRDAPNAARNRTVTRDAAARHGASLRYFGLEEQEETVARLSGALPRHRAAIEFLLGRRRAEVVSHGRAFNFALLLSFGGTLVQVDDDIVCRGCPPPIPTSGILKWGPQGRKAAFFPSEEERAGHCTGVRANPVAPMGASVGERLATVAGELRRREGLDLCFDGITTDDAQALLGGRGRVAVSACGLYGDPGTASSSWMFGLDGGSRHRLAGDPDRYAAALRHRNSWLGTDSHLFARRHGLLSPLRAMDHRTPLPPHFPILRGEDYLLGSLLPLVDRDAWFLEFPWAVPHLPGPRRQWPADLLERPETISFARLTGLLWEERLSSPLSTDVGHRLGLLGRQIRDAGEADPGAMEEAMSYGIRRLRSGFLRTLERQLRSGEDLPPWYQRDLLRLLEVNRVALEDSRPPVPAEMAEPGADPVAWTLELWREYGAALQAWPEILAAHGETASAR